MPFFPKPRRRPAPADTDISTTDAAPRPFRPRPATGTQPADRPRFQREERNEFSSRDDRPRREDRPRDGRRPAGAFPRTGRPADRRDARPGSRSRNEAFQDPWVDGQPRFLPMSRAEMQALGWKELDVLLVNGDAYVDHPAFGPVLLGRWLVAHGFRVGIVAQPRWQSPDDLLVMGRPRLFVGVSAGALDSMLAHYTAFRKKRHDDAYTPGGKAGARPNRACLVYANLARQAFPGLPVILGGIEASLRRTTHYDFWTDSLRRSILLDAKADLLIYGMGELAMLECARRLAEGKSLHGIDGTAWLAKVDENNVPVDLPEEWLDLPRMQLPSHEAVQAEATELLRLTQMLEQQVHRQNAWAQQMVGDRALVLAPPARPLTTEEMDKIYSLPYARAAHPRYREPLPADEMLRTSITSHRGCGGGCSFCSLALHQGRRISSRSQESILAEARKLVAQSRRGQVAISDVGGPTANMWQAHCALDDAMSAKAEPGARPSSRCRRSSCCYPTVCKSFITPQMQHVGLLREVAALPGVRQVRVASGVRADLALNDPEALAAYTGEFTGGQLRPRAGPDAQAGHGSLRGLPPELRGAEPSGRARAVCGALHDERLPRLYGRGHARAGPLAAGAPLEPAADPVLHPHAGQHRHGHVLLRPQRGRGRDLCGPQRCRPPAPAPHPDARFRPHARTRRPCRCRGCGRRPPPRAPPGKHHRALARRTPQR